VGAAQCASSQSTAARCRRSGCAYRSNGRGRRAPSGGASDSASEERAAGEEERAQQDAATHDGRAGDPERLEVGTGSPVAGGRRRVDHDVPDDDAEDHR
jgi:hypothetical protein